jgi:hypothetical protein
MGHWFPEVGMNGLFGVNFVNDIAKFVVLWLDYRMIFNIIPLPFFVNKCKYSFGKMILPQSKQLKYSG